MALEIGAAPAGASTYVDTAVTTGETYFYALTAFSGLGESLKSAAIAASLPPIRSASVMKTASQSPSGNGAEYHHPFGTASTNVHVWSIGTRLA